MEDGGQSGLQRSPRYLLVVKLEEYEMSEAAAAGIRLYTASN